MPSSPEYSLTDAKAPKSRPIESLRDVDNWKPTSADIWNISTVPYDSSKLADPAKEKLLLCHDMANGKSVAADTTEASIIAKSL
jgi:hypothetical protein